MNLREAIIFAQTKFKHKGITSAPLDAEVLLLEAINHKRRNKIDKSWLYLNSEKYTLSKKEKRIFMEFVRRRGKNEPIAYITGRKEFYGLDFIVGPDVLIPRAETEIIVEKVLKILNSKKQNFTLLDIGTGSGCIIISIMKSTDVRKSSSRIEEAFANDISKKAIAIARKNVKMNNLSGKITFLKCDLEKAIKKVKDRKNIIITANLPYISPEDYHKLKPNVKKYEPKIALTAKDKGLYHINRLINKVALISQNFDSFYFLLEADPKQMESIGKLAREKIKIPEIEIMKDLRGKKRTIVIHKDC